MITYHTGRITFFHCIIRQPASNIIILVGVLHCGEVHNYVFAMKILYSTKYHSSKSYTYLRLHLYIITIVIIMMMMMIMIIIISLVGLALELSIFNL